MVLGQEHVLIHDLRLEEKLECVEKEGFQMKGDLELCSQNWPRYPYEYIINLQ